MQVSAAMATTSSRLNRETQLPFEIEEKLEEISTIAINYCHDSLDKSSFFSQIKQGTLPLSAMQYVFLQYHFWRDRLHQWFSLCIVKADSCSEPDKRLAIMSLADHLFTDLKDDHTEMFLNFLEDLELREKAIFSTQRSQATKVYESSFFDDFGYGMDNFYEAIAGLSGRELMVSIRNQFLLKYYFDRQQKKQPTWVALHAELELDHFYDSISSAIIKYVNNTQKMEALMGAIKTSIDRHLNYFDDLLNEYNQTQMM